MKILGHVLTATGPAMLPRINHGIYTEKEEWAIEQCNSVILALSKAGYFTFILWNAETQTEVKAFRVKEREPEIIVIESK